MNFMVAPERVVFDILILGGAFYRGSQQINRIRAAEFVYLDVSQHSAQGASLINAQEASHARQ